MAGAAPPTYRWYHRDINCFASPKINYDTWEVDLGPALPALNDYLKCYLVYIHHRLVEKVCGNPRETWKKIDYEDKARRMLVTFTSGFTVSSSTSKYSLHDRVISKFLQGGKVNLRTIMRENEKLSFEYLSKMVECYPEAIASMRMFIRVFSKVARHRRTQNLPPYKAKSDQSTEEIFDLTTTGDVTTNEANVQSVDTFFNFSLTNGPIAGELRAAVERTLNHIFESNVTCPVIDILRNKENFEEPGRRESLDEAILNALNETAIIAQIRREVISIVRNFLLNQIWLKCRLTSYILKESRAYDFDIFISGLRNGGTDRDANPPRHPVPVDAIDHSFVLSSLSEEGRINTTHNLTAARLQIKIYDYFLRYNRIANDLLNQAVKDVEEAISTEDLDLLGTYVKRMQIRQSFEYSLSKLKVNGSKFYRYTKMNPGSNLFANGQSRNHPRGQLLKCDDYRTKFLLLYFVTNQNSFTTTNVSAVLVDDENKVIDGPANLQTTNFSDLFNRMIPLTPAEKKTTFARDDSTEAKIFKEAILAASGNIIYSGEGQNNVLDESFHRCLLEMSLTQGIKFEDSKIKSYDSTCCKFMAKVENSNPNPTGNQVCQQVGKAFLNPCVHFSTCLINVSQENPVPKFSKEVELIESTVAGQQWLNNRLNAFGLEIMNTVPMDLLQLGTKDFSRASLQYIISVDYERLRQQNWDQIILTEEKTIEAAFMRTFNPPGPIIKTPTTVWPWPGKNLGATLKKYVHVSQEKRQRILDLARFAGIRMMNDNNRAYQGAGKFEYLYEGMKRADQQTCENECYNHYLRMAFWRRWENIHRTFFPATTGFENSLNQELQNPEQVQGIIRLFGKILPTSFDMSSKAIREDDRLFCCSPKDPRGPFAPFNVRHCLDESYLRYQVYHHTYHKVDNMTQHQRLDEYAAQLTKRQVMLIVMAKARDLQRARGAECPKTLKNILQDRLGRNMNINSIILIPKNIQHSITSVAEDWVPGRWPLFFNIVQILGLVTSRKSCKSAISRKMFDIITFKRRGSEDNNAERPEDDAVLIQFEDWADNNREARVDTEQQHQVQQDDVERYLEPFNKIAMTHKFIKLGIAEGDAMTPIHLEGTTGYSFPSQGHIRDNRGRFPGVLTNTDIFHHLEAIYSN